MLRQSLFSVLILAACATTVARRPESYSVVFFGDSITAAWTRLFPTLFPGKPYVGRGVSGETTRDMLLRFDRDVIALKPSVVVILAGTNDIAGNDGPMSIEETQRNLEEMTARAQAAGIRVVLSSVLPVHDYPWKRGLEPAPKIIRLNTLMRDYAARVGAVYLDYHRAMVDGRGGLPLQLAADGVHPNEAGYRLMGPLVERAIDQALEGRRPRD